MNHKFVKNKYLVEVSIGEHHRRYMNTLLLSIVELDEEHVSLVDKCAEDRAFSCQELNTLHQLRELGIVRFKGEDEFLHAHKMIEDMRSYKFLSAVFCLTFSCNLNCIYCYERDNFENQHTFKSMSPDIVRSSLLWMKELMQANKIQSAKITFFGGEPLICFPTIYEIGKQLKDIFPPDADITLYMSTNGYLLNADKIKKLKEIGLRTLQITLDGPENIHDKRRPHKNGNGSFSKIASNIKLCVEKGLNVDLMTVCDSENSSFLFSLIDYMGRAIKGTESRSMINWNFTLVEPTESCADRSVNTLFGKEYELTELLIQTREYAAELGFEVVFPYTSNICARQLDYSFGIGPEGELYPCYGVFGNKQHSIGTIFDPHDVLETKSREWARKDPYDNDCIECELFPLCRGSRCQHMAAVICRESSLKKHCEKDFLLKDIKLNLQSKITTLLANS